MNQEKGTMRAVFPDKDNQVSGDLPILNGVTLSVGESVLCLFLGNGMQTGFCLGFFKTDGDGG
ncbi:hypothetical protein HPY27_01550 [Brevibacillus sp. HB1.1]|uniref:hypothetical protein n=1 Tax=Brevibacillus sp. HB1.1 TaxID=2738808 RepID=UPI0015752BEB|nr:hypothetical protein [Brevibacillus sp. HB1.1]NTU28845.1 hypothetical protein [Brevibacillus sp. HB1.1]